MSKKKIDVSNFTNNLRGESVFFPTKNDTPAPDQAGEPVENKDQGNVLENKETSLQGNKFTRKRAAYPKVTYQLNPTVTNLLQDTKIALQRQYHVKVSLAEIVEEAIQQACADLQGNKETSFLVTLFTRRQANK